MKYLIALVCGAGLALPAFSQSQFFVRLNEVLANNASIREVPGVPNPENKLFDFVELYNTAGTPIDMSGAAISASDLNMNPLANRFTFPAGTMVPAQGYLVVVFDPTDAASFGFKGTSGDQVYLYDNAGFLTDFLAFGIQIPDLTVGRDAPGVGNWVLTSPTLGAANVVLPTGDVSQLKINEWLADPDGGDDFLELYNPGAMPVALAGLILGDSSAQESIPGLSFIGTGPDAFVAFIADDDPNAEADHVPFKLSRGGEYIQLLRAEQTVIDRIDFGPQESGKSEGRVPDGSANIIRLERLTPGSANFSRVTSVVINELLAHADLPYQDAIELHNLTDQPVDISGWGITDRLDRPGRYRIPAGTILGPRGYRVFFQYQFDGAPASDPFQFESAEGGTAYLVQIDANGTPLAYTDQKYAATQNAVSLGRYVASDGNVEFVPMKTLTFGKSPPLFARGTGAPNSGPLIGPVIINELMYHGPTNSGAENVFDEYVELRNVTSKPVQLFDPHASANHWQLRNGVEFDFPNGATIPAGGYVLVVNFDPAQPTNATVLAEFRAKYSVPTNVQVLGPMSGRLANEGETVELWKPDPPEPGGFVPYVFVERVQYDNNAPWPPGASGTGFSLQRRHDLLFGNDPANWKVAEPTAGRPNVAPLAITAQPQSQLVLLRTNATFSVSVNGELPRFQWYFKGRPLGRATNSSYTVVRPLPGRAGEYNVVITNLSSRVESAVATLGVIIPVNIVGKPANITRTAGPLPVPLSLKVRAVTGTQPIRYQWLKNDQPLLNETNRWLTFSNALTTADSGAYKLVASNALSTKTSLPAIVTVNPVP